MTMLTSVLHPAYFRVKDNHAMPITRENVDKLLDAGNIECAMRNGNWWSIRRNGATKHWKRDASRIYIPFKMGYYGYGNITETDFRTMENV